MIGVDNYSSFGGKHVESAALKNILAHCQIDNPHTGEPFSEALCFGIAGGIGIGYSFCPSVLRHGVGSGVGIVGRHRIYATQPTWYQGFCDRLGLKTHVTETSAKGKAYKNLVSELAEGKPTVVWCGSTDLSYLGNPLESCGLYMHTFVIYGVDEEQGLAYGMDRAPASVSLTLEELAQARNRVCSHKNRTLTITPVKSITKKKLKEATLSGIRECLEDLILNPKMKTFSLSGLETWAKMICNDSNKEGWGKVFDKGWMYCALRDVYSSIETGGTGGGLYRPMYADFLNEAAEITGKPALNEVAEVYDELGKEWSALADAILPNSIAVMKKTKSLMKKQRKAFEGNKNPKTFLETTKELRALESKGRADEALSISNTEQLRESLRDRILTLHQKETEAAGLLCEVIK